MMILTHILAALPGAATSRGSLSGQQIQAAERENIITSGGVAGRHSTADGRAGLPHLINLGTVVGQLNGGIDGDDPVVVLAGPAEDREAQGLVLDGRSVAGEGGGVDCDG